MNQLLIDGLSVWLIYGLTDGLIDEFIIISANKFMRYLRWLETETGAFVIGLKVVSLPTRNQTSRFQYLSASSGAAGAAAAAAAVAAAAANHAVNPVVHCQPRTS